MKENVGYILCDPRSESITEYLQLPLQLVSVCSLLGYKGHQV